MQREHQRVAEEDRPQVCGLEASVRPARWIGVRSGVRCPATNQTATRRLRAIEPLRATQPRRTGQGSFVPALEGFACPASPARRRARWRVHRSFIGSPAGGLSGAGGLPGTSRRRPFSARGMERDRWRSPVAHSHSRPSVWPRTETRLTNRFPWMMCPLRRELARLAIGGLESCLASGPSHLRRRPAIDAARIAGRLEGRAKNHREAPRRAGDHPPARVAEPDPAIVARAQPSSHPASRRSGRGSSAGPGSFSSPLPHRSQGGSDRS